MLCIIIKHTHKKIWGGVTSAQTVLNTSCTYSDLGSSTDFGTKLSLARTVLHFNRAIANDEELIITYKPV